MEKLLTAEDVAAQIPSRRKGATVCAETIMAYYRQGCLIGDKRIKLRGKSVPGRVVFTQADVQKFIDEVTEAKEARKKSRRGKDPKFYLQQRGIIP